MYGGIFCYHDAKQVCDFLVPWSKRRQAKTAKDKTVTPKRRQSQTATGQEEYNRNGD